MAGEEEGMLAGKTVTEAGDTHPTGNAFLLCKYLVNYNVHSPCSKRVYSVQTQYLCVSNRDFPLLKN